MLEAHHDLLPFEDAKVCPSLSAGAVMEACQLPAASNSEPSGYHRCLALKVVVRRGPILAANEEGSHEKGRDLLSQNGRPSSKT